MNEYVLLLNQRLPAEKAVLQCKADTSAYILLVDVAICGPDHL